MSVEPWKLTAIEGVKRIREGRMSAEEWSASLLSRIGACDAGVKAWFHVDGDGATNAARQSDRRRSDEPALSLAGLPVAAKDIIDIAGLPCERGSQLFVGRVAARDAWVIRALRRRGSVFLGKTVTCELATNAISPTRNPWNTNHSPGGSSSGSAAAVAAGMVPVALGTQTGGSLLRPAAYCGAIGFKPSIGSISCEGVLPLSWSLDHLGFIARSVADIDLLMASVGGDPKSTTRRIPFKAKRPRRVAFLKEDFLPKATTEVAERLESAAQQLRDAGIEVIEERMPQEFAAVHAATRTIIRSESAAVYEDLLRANPDAFGSDIRNNVVTGLMVPAVHYLRALRVRSEFSRQIEAMFDTYDLLLSPSNMDTAPIWDVSTGDPLFSEPFSNSGHPAITLPAGFGAGKLPIGLQLAGRRDGDAELLMKAVWCEAELGWSAKIVEPGQGDSE